MSRSVISVQTEIFSWARERRGFDLETAAHRIGVTPAKLHSLEVGDALPTPAQIRHAAEAYLVSPAVFFLPDAPDEGFDPPKDFRVLGSDQRPGFSPELRKEIDRVRAQRSVMIELEELGLSLSRAIDFTISPLIDIEEAALSIRGWLGIEPSPDGRNGRRDSLLGRLIEAIERRGILVSQVSGIPVKEMRGFCIAERPFPMIVLNGADALSARLFTLLHELVHILLGEDGVCNDAGSNNGDETFCNAVAAAIAIPRDALLRNPLVRSATRSKDWTFDELEQLSAPFGVSREALLRRLLSLEKTTSERYRALRALLLRSYETLQTPTQTGGPRYDVLLLRNLGPTYVRSVLTARNRGVISDSTLSDYLFAKLKHAAPMADRLGVPFE